MFCLLMQNTAALNPRSTTWGSRWWTAAWARGQAPCAPVRNAPFTSGKACIHTQTHGHALAQALHANICSQNYTSLPLLYNRPLSTSGWRIKLDSVSGQKQPLAKGAGQPAAASRSCSRGWHLVCGKANFCSALTGKLYAGLLVVMLPLRPWHWGYAT